ncbi:hypothetical protein Tter_1778 [Thermobaculum terrenum ATCC BAA-798]|uniref:Uncharacterized protein n=1 Tax=Thermobaculum terrenum (strain ATCC BAA-798 / CCMEE 7001 / YNP1) TaxID=525904 RepID=D1CD19_THET1|nr:hypothetical protein Tter_1778 [Thermobaculum terrenum ATCC BAA-798]
MEWEVVGCRRVAKGRNVVEGGAGRTAHHKRVHWPHRGSKSYGKFPISRSLKNREIGNKCAWHLACDALGCGVDSEDGLSGRLPAERLGEEW